MTDPEYPALLPPVRVKRKTPSPAARFPFPWVPYPQGTKVLKELDALLYRPTEGRPECIAITADANFGKSHLLDYFVDSYPDLVDPAPRIQVLFVELPFKADGSALLRSLLKAMGAAVNTRHPPDVLMDKFCVRARALRVLMIVIDEFTNGNWGRQDASKTLLQAVRAISNRLGRPIVIAGTTKIDALLRNDDQLHERFRRIDLPTWTDPDEVAQLIAGFERTFEMPGPRELATPTIAAEVSVLTSGKLGRIAHLMRKAASIARAEGAASVTAIHVTAAASYLVGLPTSALPPPPPKQ